MAIKITLDSFLAVIKRSNLLTEEQLNTALENFRTEKGLRTDAKPFAEHLVRNKLLTIWQAEKSLQGKHKGFFLGRYRLLSLLGKGGMSSVYLAEHTVMKRQCALKVLPAKRVNDASYLGRFHREAQAVAALDHPNIVRAYDVDMVTDGSVDIHFLAMEFVQGKSLLELVSEKGTMGPDEAIDAICQSALGLEHAHRAGLVHRDIKPGNLLISSNGMIKVLDLGLARFFDDEDASLTVQHDEKVLGTADYISPEQAIDSHKVDCRTDIYSLGCTLYFLLTGHPPFNSGSLAQRLVAHQTKQPPPVTNTRADVPAEVLAILTKMMAKRAESRYQTAQEVVDAITQWKSTRVTSHDRGTVHTGNSNQQQPAAFIHAASTPVAQISVHQTDSHPVISKAQESGNSGNNSPDDPLGNFLNDLADSNTSKSVAKPASSVETAHLAEADTDVTTQESDSDILDLNLLDPDSGTIATPCATNKRPALTVPPIAAVPPDTTVSIAASPVQTEIDTLDVSELLSIERDKLPRKEPTESRASINRDLRTVTPRWIGIAGGIALLLLSTGGWYYLSRGSSPPVISASTKPAKPLPSADTPIIEVGPRGHFIRIQDAIHFVGQKFRPKSPTDTREIQVAGGYTYVESLQLTSEGRQSYPRNVTIRSMGDQQAFLRGDGQHPVISIQGVEGLTLDGFVVDAREAPVALRVSGFSPATRLQNLSVRHFTRVGVELVDAAAQTGQELQLDSLHIAGDSETEIGIQCQSTGGGNTVCLLMKNLRVIGPLESGLESSGTFWKSTISDSIFSQCNAGVRFRRGTLVELTIANNTFAKNRLGIALTQSPETGSGQLQFARNLFSGNREGDVVLERGSATGLADALLLPDLGRQTNRSDRPSPDANGIDLFSGSGSRIGPAVFVSEDPNHQDFMKPTSQDVRVQPPASGTKSYVGAVAP